LHPLGGGEGGRLGLGELPALLLVVLLVSEVRRVVSQLEALVDLHAQGLVLFLLLITVFLGRGIFYPHPLLRPELKGCGYGQSLLLVLSPPLLIQVQTVFVDLSLLIQTRIFVL
jgi:hypothetical protein